MGTPLKGMGELETKYRDAVHAYGKIVMYKYVGILLLEIHSIAR